ncbi:MAG: NUDIX domain-containing protein [Patescibacteria group bacterium]
MSTSNRPCGGGIVLGDSGTVALVRRRPDTLWFFPKGHLEGGETHEDGARREISEETGLTNLELLDTLGSYARPKILVDGSYDENEMKEIHMFLFAAEPHAELHPAHEITDASWVSLSHLAEKLEDAKDRAWFATVFERVRHAVQRD